MNIKMIKPLLEQEHFLNILITIQNLSKKSKTLELSNTNNLDNNIPSLPNPDVVRQCVLYIADGPALWYPNKNTHGTRGTCKTWVPA
jgi:hypothetical protein